MPGTATGDDPHFAGHRPRRGKTVKILINTAEFIGMRQIDTFQHLRDKVLRLIQKFFHALSP
ncbi:Uncharacterised protein [Escherichia coli]|nr:Uncharacterised protein [Escherichia coli]